MFTAVLLSLIVVSVQDVRSAKILLASPQIKSHILEQLALGEELVLRGHDVYIAIGSRYPNPGTIEKLGIKTLKYHIPDDTLFGISTEFERKMVEMVLTSNSVEEAALRDSKMTSKLVYGDCEYMMNDTGFLQNIKSIRFDLVIVEPFVLSPCYLILPKYFGIKFISMSSFFFLWNIGLPVLPSFYPYSMASIGTSPENATFLTRIKNVIEYFTFYQLISYIAPENTTLLQRFAPEIETWDDVMRQSELFFIENDHHFGSTVPTLPHFISVAGLTTRQPQILPPNFLEIFEKSQDGVILLSFGSIADHFPNYIIEKFLNAFSNLTQTVLVKFTISDDVQLPKNVKALSWLPQNDILAHPKTNLFITHCGNNGQHEALYHGVPMIGFPLFAEQESNCHRAYKKGFGLVMNIRDFTVEQLFSNIQEVFSNSSYHSAIERASDIFRNQPMHARERAVFWVEHVIRYGGAKHLRSITLDMPIYQLFMFDILGLFAIILIAFVVSAILFVKLMQRICCAQPTALATKVKDD